MRSPEMCVSLDVTAVPAQPAGAGRYVMELVAALMELDPLGDYCLVARGDDGKRWKALAPRATVLARAPSSRPARLAWEQLRMARLLERIPATVHHGPHYTIPHGVSCPVAVTVHDLTMFTHPEWHERSKVALFRHAVRKSARTAEAVICVSRRTADQLVECVGEPAGRLVVIPHGVDHGRFAPAQSLPGKPCSGDAAVLDHLRITWPYVCFLGTVEPRKDVPSLVAAFDLLAPRWPELRLVIAGYPGWGEAALDAALREARHADRVVRLGYVGQDDAPALLRQARVVAYPSLEEGFGLPALEALACGAPLVTTRGSAMDEVVGDAALLVQPGDPQGLDQALQAVLEGGSDVCDRRKRGIELAREYTWERSAAAHLALYAELAVQAGGTH